MILPIILSTLAIMSVSLLGVFTVNSLFKDSITRNLPYLISFSAGVFIFTAGFMVVESSHLLENYYYVCGLVLAGYMIAWLINGLIPAFHHHHGDECIDHKHDTSGNKVLLGDAIHNIADGLILVPAFLVSPWLGVGTAISIFAHEILQEIAEFLVLRKAGYSTARALTTNFLISSTMLIGVGIGLYVVNTLLLQGILLALAAGFFINIIFEDLIPHEHDHSQKSFWMHAGIILLGLGLIGVINTSFTHSHSHEHQEEDHVLHAEHEDESVTDPEHADDNHIEDGHDH